MTGVTHCLRAIWTPSRVSVDFDVIQQLKQHSPCSHPVSTAAWQTAV